MRQKVGACVGLKQGAWAHLAAVGVRAGVGHGQVARAHVLQLEVLVLLGCKGGTPGTKAIKTLSSAGTKVKRY